MVTGRDGLGHLGPPFLEGEVRRIHLNDDVRNTGSFLLKVYSKASIQSRGLDDGCRTEGRPHNKRPVEVRLHWSLSLRFSGLDATNAEQSTSPFPCLFIPSGNNDREEELPREEAEAEREILAEMEATEV